MTTRNAPYRHKDGSNCWTKQCSRGNISSSNSAKYEAQRKFATQMGDSFVHVDAIAPIEDFYAAAENGDVYRNRHPSLPYSIFKYSPITQYSKNWNEITLASRGLVINDDTGEIVSRPFGKFFNYSEHATPEELMVGPVSVSEKLDGSLGISMNTPDGLVITTSGGFQSPQGAHATKIYRERYEGNWKPRKGVTYMWEIIYPENRIVVNYGDEDDIHLLGAVNNRTGKSIPLKELKEWKWKRATEHEEFDSIHAAVAAPNRTNHEGYIVHYTQTDARVKIKHDEYLTLHRFATGINKRRVWEMMREGHDMEQWRQQAPEEFLDFIDSQTTSIRSEFDTQYSQIEGHAARAKAAMKPGHTQKDLALWVQNNVPKEDRGFVFPMIQRGKIEGNKLNGLWDRIKPPAEKGFWLAGDGKVEGES
jgi:RNA ligase